MKDLGKIGPDLSAALERLKAAVTRLDAAAAKAGKAHALAADHGQKLERLQHDHASLKDAAGRVARRLDAAIDRLASAVED